MIRLSLSVIGLEEEMVILCDGSKTNEKFYLRYVLWRSSNLWHFYNWTINVWNSKL